MCQVFRHKFCKYTANEQRNHKFIYLFITMDGYYVMNENGNGSQWNELTAFYSENSDKIAFFPRSKKLCQRPWLYIFPIFDGSAESVNFIIILNFQRLKFLRNQSFQPFQRNRKFSWKEFAITNFGETLN